MQIVRSLGGYTLGRSDEVRRAMSKKKLSVMEQEREYFVYGNKQLDIPGCVGNGISAEVGNKIYDSMIDFAKYAFNKSHAAAYAVVAYQTAFLKYYYPVEYMAALITSVIDNAGKTSEYILASRNMGIQILPPDINEGDVGFSVSQGAIRYALTAIKNVGRPVIEGIVKERNEKGSFTNLKDFIIRTAERDVNKRAVENFIKAGAFDSLGGNRRQYISIYSQVIDSIQKDRKSNMAGQISLFDIAGEDEKEEFDIVLPDIAEFPKETILQFEKEVLGVYVSGHPIEEYESLWRRVITNPTTDFFIMEDTGNVKIEDNSKVVIGGIISEKKTKYTKNDKIMAFLTIEDMVGSVEVLVFPRQYDKYSMLLNEDAKVFVHGSVSVEEQKDAKVICEKVIAFDNYPRKLWIKFKDREVYESLEASVKMLLEPSDGIDEVIFYLEKEKQMKTLAKNKTVKADISLIEALKSIVGGENVKAV